VDGNKAHASYKHGKWVAGALWSKDEKRILFRCADGTVQVWDVDGNKALASYKHRSRVLGASWSTEERRILSWNKDGAVQVRDLTVTPWIAVPPRSPEVDFTAQVEAQTGMRLDETGTLAPLPRQQWLQRKQRFAELHAQASR
jgi:hypothetical protein